MIDQVGGFRQEYDGAQDYDMILRCCEKAKKLAIFLKYYIIGEYMLTQRQKIQKVKIMHMNREKKQF